jgi:hypothetical protein
MTTKSSRADQTKRLGAATSGDREARKPKFFRKILTNSGTSDYKKGRFSLRTNGKNQGNQGNQGKSKTKKNWNCHVSLKIHHEKEIHFAICLL